MTGRRTCSSGIRSEPGAPPIPIACAPVDPDKPAIILSDGSAALSFGALDRRSTQLARRLRQAGLAPGDRVALLMDNEADHLVAAWAARRSEFRFVPINWHLRSEEAAYVVDNSDAVALIASDRLRDLAREAAATASAVRLLLSSGAGGDGFEGLEAIYKTVDAAPLADEREGGPMPYSSGTTGWPKGILRPLAGLPFPAPAPFDRLIRDEYGIDADTVYLSPAPLYHAAPMTWSMGTHLWGGATVMMPSFDPEQVLQAIERHGVTHAQFVPTHFIRMLRLPDAVKARYDLSSLRTVVHSAAPCPPQIKQAMVEWWGPVIHEYYSGSERCGFTVLRPDDWRAHQGTVGRSITGAIHVLDPETGAELPHGEVGLIYFENAQPYEYHRLAHEPGQGIDARGWGCLGDMGWVDDEGYLTLADRASHMIISGGVNIYPREIEDLLSGHAEVADVAVIGVPDSEFGESVKAVVQLRDPSRASEALAAELQALCQSRLATFKCPRSVDFVETLPRLPSGKLIKRELRKLYWPDARKMI